MNKFCLNLFSFLYPFYPFWAWLCFSFAHKPIELVVTSLLFPLAIYFLIYQNKRLPNYLLCFLLFTAYHVGSAFMNDALPDGSSKLYFLLSDPNVLASLFFIVVENTQFDERFIDRMNRNILLVLLVSLVVSVLQTRDVHFFFNSAVDYDLSYTNEQRLPSIYSWTGLNSVGVTFPILVAIAISVYESKTPILAMSILTGIVVAFLTKGRYIMISTIIAFMQLFFSRKYSMTRKMYFVGAFVALIAVAGVVAQKASFNINDVIEKRILEKDSDFASAKARVLSYEVFLKVFPEHPVFGVGPKTRPDVIAMLQGEAPLIHVGYLCFLYFYGFFGFGFLLLALFFLLKDAWGVGRKYGFWASFYGLLGFCFANATMVYFNFSEMGIVLAVIYIRFLKSIHIVEIDENEITEEALLTDNLPVAYD